MYSATLIGQRNSGIQELSFDEVQSVGGADRGDVAVAGVLAGAAFGARVGMVAGPWGLLGGAFIGGIGGYFLCVEVYDQAMKGSGGD